jgi:uncharacterized protein (DUF2126 family)
MSTTDRFAAAVRHHDAQIAAMGLTIWVGSEPTFTDRTTHSPEWLSQALGGDKERRAEALLGGLCRRHTGGVVLRSVGRQYPGEERPRWNLGLYRRRDGAPIWHGPPDPLLSLSDPTAASGRGDAFDLDGWASAMAAELAARSLPVTPLAAAAPRERRLLMRADAALSFPDADDPRLRRASVHARATPASGLHDELAETGAYLFILGRHEVDGRPTARIELPLFAGVGLFLAVLESVAQASLTSHLVTLIVAGHPPPVDATVEWTTVTPDPAVIEINSAPSVDAADFLLRSRKIHAAATEQGLAPYRLYFNGAVADSGGGGQITLGGPSPAASPFLLEPRLLPRLVRFFNRHPALSYLYSHDFVGSSGQSVRADERGGDAFDELCLAVDLLEREDELSPELLWHSLAPFLCDAAGNSHRAEMNIEKLWNPFLAGRGKQGLVEFRALRMQHTPERATALACLLRAVTAMLARDSSTLPLIDWGRELHARFALPFYLEQDLDQVLQALAAAGLELGEGDPRRIAARRVPLLGASAAARLHAGNQARSRVLAAAGRFGEPGTGWHLPPRRRQHRACRTAATRAGRRRPGGYVADRRGGGHAADATRARQPGAAEGVRPALPELRPELGPASGAARAGAAAAVPAPSGTDCGPCRDAA